MKKATHLRERIMLALFVLCVPALTFAQAKLKDGNYTTADGSYTINVKYDAKSNSIIVTEPNKTSEYTAVRGNVYGFTNPTNGREYRLAIVDATTLEAFKPASPDDRTQLLHSGGGNGSGEGDEVNEDFDKYQEIAEKYIGKMVSDPDNAQLWAFCGAAANARSTMNAKGFEAYAKKAVRQVAPILEDTSTSPCPDAMPVQLWKEALRPQ